MTEINYNKLIRDKIPEIIKDSGKVPIIERAEGKELLELLNLKLVEELEEYTTSGEIEELTDLVEVIYGILKHKGISLEEFESIRKRKKLKRGGFDKGLVLVKVIEVKDMISSLEFVRMVDVQSETINRYIREGTIVPDLEIPMGNNRTFKYFKEETIYEYVKKFNWQLITPANMKDKFMEYIERMDMSYSYKPLLVKAIFDSIDDRGRVAVENIVDYFMEYYGNRKEKGLVVEKKRCIYLRDDYTRKEVERNIFSNPFKRFEDMNFMKRSKDVEYVEVNKHIMKKLSKDEVEWIVSYSDEKLKEYYGE